MASHIRMWSDSGPVTTTALSPFVYACGAALNSNTFFIACKFKKPVCYQIYYKQQIGKIIPQEHSILVVTNKELLNLDISSKTILVFSLNESDKQLLLTTPSKSEIMLLHSLFPPNTVTYYTYIENVLYAVTRQNPFDKTYFVKMRKDIAFRTLEYFYTQFVSEQCDTSLEGMVRFRLFHRNAKEEDKIHLFKNWFTLAHFFVSRMFYNRFGIYMSVSCSQIKKIHQIVKRLKTHEHTVSPNPADFYTCEVTLDSDEPLGLQFTLRGNIVDYVSTMVVSKLNRRFRDVNGVECDFWCPLFQNSQKFQKYGIDVFIRDMASRESIIESLLCYLSVQSSEKYKYMFEDIKIVESILVGKHFTSSCVLRNRTSAKTDNDATDGVAHTILLTV